MMFWFQLLIWVVTTVVSELVRPKPTFEDARPAGLGDFNFPTATEGRALPIVWGRVKLSAPNLVWYGNFRKEARTENIKTGMFSSEDVITGYRYYVGMQFAICHGPIDSFRRVWVNDKVVVDTTVSVDGINAGIDNPNLFGGEEHGSGGMYGNIRYYMGSTTQGLNSYLSSHQSPQPAYRGTAYAVWEGGWVGNTTNVAPWAFEVERIPDGLNLASAYPGAEEPNTGDCNPMNVLYEILTDTDWGLSIDGGDIDTTNFQAAAVTLANEGNGFAMVLDRATEITTLIDELQRQIDGSLFFNRAQGQWQVKLARADYTPAALDVYDESNIVEVKEFVRQTWEETTNQVRVSFIDRTDQYKDTYALAQDAANMDIQGQTVQSDVSYPGVKNATLANALAWRDLKALSYPLAKVKLSANREAWQLGPGSVFKFSWDRLGVSEMIVRVQKINYGKAGSSQIEIDAIQDIFASSSGVYADPTGTGWDEPTDEPAYASAGNTLVLEAPRQLVIQDPFAPNQQPRVWMGCRFPGDGTVNMKAYTRIGNAQPITADYDEDATVGGFVLAGTLDSSLAAYGTVNRPDTSYTIDVTGLDNLDSILVDGDSTLVSDLATIAYIDGEYIGFEKAEALGGGGYRLSRIHRGLFSSAPKAHASSSLIWFMSQGGNLTSRLVYPLTNNHMDVQLRGVNGAGDETTEGETPEIEVFMTMLYQAPLAPRDPVLNGAFADQTVSLDTSYITETGRTGQDAYALEVEVTPRDYNVDDPVADTALTAAWEDDDPEFWFTLTLSPGLGDIDVGPIVVDDLSHTPTAYILRNDIIIACGANQVIPSTGLLQVQALHTKGGLLRTNPFVMELDLTSVTSALQGADDLTHGGVDSGTSPAIVEYGETGTYDFDIFTALPSSGVLEARINGGSWATVVAAAASTGTLAVTAGDEVELRWQVTGPAADQFFTVTGPTSEQGYGVLLA